MKIYLVDVNADMIDAWETEFLDFHEVEIVHDGFCSFMDKHPEVDGIVSPANSFGLMDGGYDLAICHHFGEELQDVVQSHIKRIYHGVQPVGSCLRVPFKECNILHTPTMRTPEKIRDPRVIFDCMISCLSVAAEFNIKSIVIPAFGACTGRVPHRVVAKYMAFAYKVFNNPAEKINWGYAHHIKNTLKEI